MIKFIAIDVDGTLLNSMNEIAPNTKKALMKCQEQGIRIILASGRPFFGLTAFVKELEMEKQQGMVIAYNGSCIIDCENENLLFNDTICLEDAKAVLEHIKKFDAYPMVDKNEYMYVNNVFVPHLKLADGSFNVIEYTARRDGLLLCEKVDLAAFLDFEPNRILAIGHPEYMQNNHPKMMEPFKDVLNCKLLSPFYFEFTAKKTDKARALDTVLTKLGFGAKNLMAFGDEGNDVSMINYAAVGVAMGNAIPELKAIADFITMSNDEDGIVVALEKYLSNVFLEKN
jgi:Cof subfamily protein (haloacid dehalogenase superfamily)